MEPSTALHYTPNGNLSGNTYAPASAGFNLADVNSVSALKALPPGIKGLIYLGMTGGANAAFQAAVQQYAGVPNLYGFYLADDPGASVSAASLKEESDWIHAHVPGAKTFIVEENAGTPANPSFRFNVANTGIDLYGISPYPIRPQFGGGANYGVIGAAVSAAEAQGIPQDRIVPVYQAFGGGGYASWTVPTPAQEQQILSTWGALVPTPAFDYAYSWGTQNGDTALVNSPGLQQVFATHNGASGPNPALAPSLAPTSGRPDILTLHVSEDAWQGDAQFTIQVDGRTVGAPQTAFASHAGGQSQAYVVQGSFGAGPHEVGVTFVNDAYGGLPGLDRNLYLDGVGFDGKTFLDASVPLHFDGSRLVEVNAAAAGLGTQPQFLSPGPDIVLPLP